VILTEKAFLLTASLAFRSLALFTFTGEAIPREATASYLRAHMGESFRIRQLAPVVAERYMAAPILGSRAATPHDIEPPHRTKPCPKGDELTAAAGKPIQRLNRRSLVHDKVRPHAAGTT
jgi:hypothetical protein